MSWRFKPLMSFCCMLALALQLVSCAPQITRTGADGPLMDVCFTPPAGCTASIVNLIANAEKEILVQAYSFTSEPIAKALVDANKRGVSVQILLDKSQQYVKYSSAGFTAQSGIPTFIDSHHAIAHNKIMIIDRSVVITGSFNFTKAAEERNAENLLIIKSADIAMQYIANWNKHRDHSEKYGVRLSYVNKAFIY